MPSIMPRRKLRLAAVAVATLLCSCIRVVIVSGPSAVSPGETVVYELGISGNSGGFIAFPTLAADVPIGWTPISGHFSGIVDDVPVEQTLVVTQSSDCNEKLGEVRSGFRRWHFQGGFGDTVTGLVQLEFLAESQPSGPFELFFAAGEGGNCFEPAIITVNREQPYALAFLQALVDGFDGVDGLDEASQSAASSDGRQLYVASAADRSFTAFDRDAATGALTFVEAEPAGVDVPSEPRGLTVSPDGDHLYGASPNTGEISTFTRDPMTGELTFSESFIDDAESLVSSADGLHVYTGGPSALTDAYSRDPSTGTLTFVQQNSNSGRLALAPDGGHLFIVRESGPLPVLIVMSRDEVTGELTFFDELGELDGLTGATEAALSPCGRHLYVVGGQAVTVLERDPETGTLSFVESETALTGGILDAITMQAVAVSPDGSHVVAGGETALSLFGRDRATGELTFVDILFAGNLPSDGAAIPGALTFAPDGRHLYVVDPSNDMLIGLETPVLFHDRFESGDLSAW